MSADEQDGGAPRAAATKVRLSGDVARFQKMLRSIERQMDQQRTIIDQFVELSRQHRLSMQSLQQQLQESLAPMQGISEMLAQQTAGLGSTSESLTAIVDEFIRPAATDMEKWQAAFSTPALDFTKALRSTQLDFKPLFDVAVRPVAATAGAPSASDLSKRVLDDFEATAREEPESDVLAVAADVAAEIADWLGLDRVPGIVLLFGVVAVVSLITGVRGFNRIDSKLGALRATQDGVVAEVDSLMDMIDTQIECAPVDSPRTPGAPERPESREVPSPETTEDR